MLLATQKEMRALQERTEQAEFESSQAKAEAAQAKATLQTLQQSVQQNTEEVQNTARKTSEIQQSADTRSIPARRNGFYTEVAVTEKKLMFEKATAINDESASKQYSFDHSFVAVPEITLGYETDNGWGVEGSLSYMKSKTTLAMFEGAGMTLSSTFDVDGKDSDVYASGTLTTEDRMSVFVSDLMGYRDFGSYETVIRPGFGLRYVDVKRQFSAEESIGSEFINAIHRYRGIGPKFSLNADFEIAPKTRLSLGGSGALVVAKERQVVEGEGGVGSDYDERLDSQKILPIVDFEFGVAYSPEVSIGDQFTLGAAITGEYWSGGGGWDFTTDGGGSDWAGDLSWGSLGGKVSGEFKF